MIVDFEVFPRIQIQHLETLELGQILPSAVVKPGEVAVSGFVGVVVPILETHEGALPAIVQVKLGEPLEDLRDGVALVEVELAVVGAIVDAFATLADRTSIGDR
ncbi:hypothetical protein D3C84_547080 [compost metagenome]